jgi:CrcB protein
MRIAGREVVAVWAGGFAGAVLRALVGDWLPHDADVWPWSTLLVNVAGAALLGWLVVRLPVGGTRRALLGTGFCGALTTFSTMQLEVLHLLDAGRGGLAVLYVGVSVAAGLAAVALAGRRREEAR